MSTPSSQPQQSCPLCDIDTVMMLILDSAQTNADQLDLHRALQQQEQHEENNNSSSPASNSAHRKQQQLQFYKNDEYYTKARKAVGILLEQFSGDLFSSSSSSSQTQPYNKNEDDATATATVSRKCNGPLDVRCIRHVITVAACFVACKFVGTKDILFVTLDNLVVNIVNEFISSDGSNNGDERNSSSSRQQQQQPEIVMKKADPSKKINLFEDSDNDHQDATKKITTSDDDLIVEKAKIIKSSNEDANEEISEAGKRDMFVDAILMAEKRLMMNCLYFAAFPSSLL